MDDAEFVSSCNGNYVEERETLYHDGHCLQFSSLVKPHTDAPSVAISLAKSLYRLLECSVCTNSMYPLIYQVGLFVCSLFFSQKSSGLCLFWGYFDSNVLIWVCLSNLIQSNLGLYEKQKIENLKV